MSSCRKWQFKAVYCFLKRPGTYHTCLLLFEEIRNLPHLSVNNDLYFEQDRVVVQIVARDLSHHFYVFI